MGVTIHFEGRLPDEAAYDAVIRLASEFARQKGWSVEIIPAENRQLARVRNEEDWDYEGATRGIELLPQALCEPFRLEFDEDLYIQEYTKTQFAPIDIHMSLVALLRLLRPRFTNLLVMDEGEYFDTDDLAHLNEQIEACNAVIEEYKRANPESLSAVRLPSGRIVDICE